MAAIDTDLETPEDPEAVDPPTNTVRNVRVKLPWRIRLAVLGLLVLAFATLWYTTRTGADTSQNGKDLDPGIVSLNPAPGDRVEPQDQINVQLKDGYDGRLAIDGTDIPEDQMVGAIPANSPVFQAGSGIRPNNKNFLGFVPGPGKAVVKLPPGEVIITVRLWSIREGEQNARTSHYTILVN